MSPSNSSNTANETFNQYSSLVQLPLRRSGPLVESRLWPILPQSDPPRSLKSLARIIDGDLCHRCGTCVGICPTSVLGLDESDYPVVKNLSACTDCELCFKVCPGDNFDVPSTSRQMFGHLPDVHDTHGHFEVAYLAHSADPQLRAASTSGGLVTGLLLHLLEKGEIDGALVVGSDKITKWKGRPYVARSKTELLESLKSKYAISPTNIGFEEIRAIPGKYAIVGLPCQIHGYHKAARLDRRLRERVVLTIGLFCHAAVEHDPMYFFWKKLGERREEVTRFVSRVGKHPGTPHVEYSKGKTEPLYFPEATGYRPSSMEILNILYRLYTPARCLTCYDATSEFADIAVGDPWLPPPEDNVDYYQGYSFALVRTGRGKQLIEEATAAGALATIVVEPGVARTGNRMMANEKRGRAWRILETHRRQGKPVPSYGFTPPKASGKELLLTEIGIFTHIFCFLKIGRRTILGLVFTRFGYSLLWLNHQRRNLRYAVDVFFARWRRKRQRSLRETNFRETNLKA